jgi:hypothetical protein
MSVYKVFFFVKGLAHNIRALGSACGIAKEAIAYQHKLLSVNSVFALIRKPAHKLLTTARAKRYVDKPLQI